MPNTRIPEEYLTQLRDSIDIEALISDYVTLKHQGRIARGLCPFHSEKTPSFTVYPETQSFYCFGCGKGGDAITFIRDIENLDYVEAVKFLSERAGLNMPDTEYDDTLAQKRRRILEMNREAARFFYKYMLTPEGRTGLQYWTDTRRLSEKTIRHFGLGYAPDEWHELCRHMRECGFSGEELVEANLARKSTKNGKTNYYDNFRNRVMVPIIDLRGNIIAFGGRVMDDSKPKYVNTSDTLVYKKSQAVFALNFAKSSGKDRLILCEGYMDVITLHQAGFTNAVAGLGTALTDEQARLISRYCSEILLSYDNDEAGRKAMDRAMEKFGAAGLEVRPLILDGGKDPDEIIKNFGAERFQSIIDGASNEIEYKLIECRKRYDVKTDDGKAHYVGDAAAILASVHSPVERDVYMSRLAEETGVHRDAIRAQVEQIRKKQERKANRVDFGPMRHEFDDYRNPKNPQDTVSMKAKKAEETILALLMNNPDFFGRISGELNPGDFVTDEYRHVYEVLSKRVQDERSIDPIHLSEDFSPDEMGRVTKIRMSAQVLSNTYGELRDCIRVLKQQKEQLAQKPASSMTDDEFRRLFRKDDP